MNGSTWNYGLFKAQVVQKTQWPIWENIRLIILGPGFNSHESFGQWLKVLANLTSLINLFSHNLGKTPLFVAVTQSAQKYLLSSGRLQSPAYLQPISFIPLQALL